MRLKCLRGQAQREDRSPAAPTDEQRANQDNKLRWPSKPIHQRLLRGTSLTFSKPRHQGGTLTDYQEAQIGGVFKFFILE